MHLFNEESLAGCFRELDGRKAVGIDGADKATYGAELNERLEELVARMKRMAYRPGPVREVLIPKEDKPGAMRPLGIANLEDKLVQKIMHKVLESIYEPLFLECSYGFRPELSCHEAIRALMHYLYRWDVQTVIDVDLANFFGTIDHSLLLERLHEKINDPRWPHATWPGCSRPGCSRRETCGSATKGSHKAVAVAPFSPTSLRIMRLTRGLRRRSSRAVRVGWRSFVTVMTSSSAVSTSEMLRVFTKRSGNG
jgi:hypothetical protein